MKSLIENGKKSNFKELLKDLKPIKNLIDFLLKNTK